MTDFGIKKAITHPIPTEIVDADGDTSVQVERGPDDDTIRFNLGGSTPITNAGTMSQSNGFTWNVGGDDLPFVLHGEAIDDVFHMNAQYGNVGLQTPNTVYQADGGSGPFLVRPTLTVEAGSGGAATNAVFRRVTNTALAGGLMTFARARDDGAGGYAAIQSSDSIGGFQWIGYDGTSFIATANVFCRVSGAYPVTPGAVPSDITITTSNPAGGSNNIFFGSADGNLGFRTVFPVAELTFEGNAVFNYSRDAKSFRVAGDTLANLFTVNPAGYVQVGGISAGSIADFRPDSITFNNGRSDINFRMESTSYNSIMFMDAGLNQIGFGEVWGSEWLIARPTGVVINETSKSAFFFRVEGDTTQHLLYVDCASDNVGINTSTPLSTLDLEGSLGLGINRDTTTKTIDGTKYQWNGNTDGGGFTYTLPPGVQDRQYKIVNTGTSGNTLTVTPDGTEHLLGANASFILNDGESLIIGYHPTDGWY